MPVQQIMVAQRIAAGGGAGLPPSTYAGLTFWYDGDGSAHYIGDTSTSGTPADAQDFNRADSANAIARIMWQSTGNPVRRIPVFGSANGLSVDNQADTMAMAVRPSAGVAPSTYVAASSILAAANKAIIFAVRVDSVRAGAAPGAGVYGNASLIHDPPGGYVGLHMRPVGGDVEFQAYNWDGSEDCAVVSEALGTWAVITMKHSGGQLRIRKNGGSWTSVASGNTTDLTNIIKFGDGWTGRMAQLCTYNANRADAELLEVERYFGAKVGLSF